MPVKDWLPAAAVAAASDRTLKAGETLFRLGDKTAVFSRSLAWRVGSSARPLMTQYPAASQSPR